MNLILLLVNFANIIILLCRRPTHGNNDHFTLDRGVQVREGSLTSRKRKKKKNNRHTFGKHCCARTMFCSCCYLYVYTILFSVRLRACIVRVSGEKRRRVDSAADPQRTRRRRRTGLLTHVKRIQPATRCCRAPKIATAGLFPYTGSKGSAVRESVRRGVGHRDATEGVGGGQVRGAHLKMHFAPPERLKIRNY